MVDEYAPLNFREHLRLTEKHQHQTPLHGIGLPQVERTGRVEHLSHNTDPIRIHLSGGTVAYLGHDDIRRLERMPKVGDRMTLTFLRHPSDTGKQECTILKAVIH